MFCWWWDLIELALVFLNWKFFPVRVSVKWFYSLNGYSIDVLLPDCNKYIREFLDPKNCDTDRGIVRLKKNVYTTRQFWNLIMWISKLCYIFAIFYTKYQCTVTSCRIKVVFRIFLHHAHVTDASDWSPIFNFVPWIIQDGLLISSNNRSRKSERKPW